nr:carboxypeptidase-like regulatory domain-containing protein [Hymenobacter arizonensis]
MATVAAVWALREVASPAARAQTPSVQHHTAEGKKRPIKSQSHSAETRISGVVRDSSTQEAVPNVAVFLKGEKRAVATDSSGRFSLLAPKGRNPKVPHTLVFHAAGYISHTMHLPVDGKAIYSIAVALRPDPSAAGAEIVASYPGQQQMIVMGLLPLPAYPAQLLPALPAKKHRSSFLQKITRLFRSS